MKCILITGADGFLGGKLTKKIVDETDYKVVAVSSFVDRIPQMIDRESIQSIDKISIMSSEEFILSDLCDLDIVGAVHFAFSRAMFPNQDIADSLDYCLKIYRKIIDFDIQNSIFISSQSVYGNISEIRKEVMPAAPNSVYAMAKYGAEKIIEACFLEKTDLQHTIIRLDNVIQSQNLVKALCRNAKESGEINLVGGKQVFSYIDAKEVPDALLALLTCEKKWQNVYNVGADKMQVSLIDIAKIVKGIAKTKGKDVEIRLSESDVTLWAGMDIDRFKNDTGWYPKLSLVEMINDIYDTV